MSKFIKLTVIERHDNGDKERITYVNVEYLRGFSWHETIQSTFIDVPDGEYEVQESPEEILKLIKEGEEWNI